jgi:hypothetical protein
VPLALGDARIAIGFDIIDRIEPVSQNQFALGLISTLPFYYVELNEGPTYRLAQVILFDGSRFVAADSRDLATNIHPGAVFFQTTQRVGAGVRLEVGWPGETYVAEVMDAVYQGADTLEININTLHVAIRWVIVITSS